MAESPLGRQLGVAVSSPLAEAADYLALITSSNPRGSAAALLDRPDVAAVLREALAEARASAEAYVEQAWLGTGAVPDHALYARLLADVTRQFAQLGQL